MGFGKVAGTVSGYLVSWVLGIAAVGVPWLAFRYAPIKVDKWAAIYVAGTLGGLALELLLGRGRVELPGPSVPSEQDQKEDERRPLGPLVDLGFLARVASSGIAAVALLLVYHALLDQTSSAKQFNGIAADPSTFGWAIFLGASSPAIWTASQKLVQSRINAVTAAVTAELAQKQKALEAAHTELAQQVTGSVDHRDDAQAVVRDTISQAAEAKPGTVDVDTMSDDLLKNLAPLAVPVDSPYEINMAQLQKALGILEAGLTTDSR